MPSVVLGVHLAVDLHGEVAERPVDREGVGDVAERILVHVEAAILRDVDPPMTTYWPS